ncbi:hypothetical protein [Cellulomonas iranensis]|uniref:DUF3558 domain-containing protein n=1 Tax=Cellulomonas iranensis TaxID=76862 RepID=A0ABU0GLL9_9CELL|nr:hypothetical protein [Cellulomonas iranensis]MDQ0426257.1 hypothetical protein [Cellulomonas iranensis]
MRAARRAVTAVAVLLAAAACATDAPSAEDAAVPPAEVRTDAGCLDPGVLDALGLELDASLRTTAPQATTRGLPPAGFVADSVLVCDRGDPLRDSAGTWWSVTATRLEGDLDDLLGEVDGTRTPRECPDDAVVPQVWLVDAMGAAVLLPADVACDGADGIPAALGTLEVVERTEHPVALAQPVTAQASAP